MLGLQVVTWKLGIFFEVMGSWAVQGVHEIPSCQNGEAPQETGLGKTHQEGQKGGSKWHQVTAADTEPCQDYLESGAAIVFAPVWIHVVAAQGLPQAACAADCPVGPWKSLSQWPMPSPKLQLPYFGRGGDRVTWLILSLQW